MKFLFFDLDGTICESKQNLTGSMLLELIRLSKNYAIYIVSGAELKRMTTQAPVPGCCYMAQNGNEVVREGRWEWKNEFKNKEKVLEHIQLIANKEKIEITKDSIDDRGCQISFSLVGHNASLEKKKAFDPDRKIRTRLLEKYPFPNAFIGGTTCIDYIPFTKGENIARYIKENRIPAMQCLYFGDALKGYGNDATVIGVIPTHQVKNPEEMLNLLKTL